MLACTRHQWMRTAAAATFAATLACRDGSRASAARVMPALDGALQDATPSCVGDGLRPTVAAPAPGLWTSDRTGTGQRVAVLIGPPRSDARTLAVMHQVESVEVEASGDTLRSRLDAAQVHLELLPPPGMATPSDAATADTLAPTQPTATYALSAHIRVAAYEPCLTSTRGPRVRYLRRDARGGIITDVMLERTSHD